jgi:photosystem II stability/assembly factor-like uncharacterized protein
MKPHRSIGVGRATIVLAGAAVAFSSACRERSTPGALPSPTPPAAAEHSTAPFARVLGGPDVRFSAVAAAGNVVLAFGNDGVYYRSEDRGLHFTRRTLANDKFIQNPAVWGESESVFYVGGQGGAFARSTDGGKSFTWLRESSAAQPNIDFVRGAPRKNVWIGGGYPAFVAHSTDRGATFRETSLGAADISFATIVGITEADELLVNVADNTNMDKPPLAKLDARGENVEQLPGAHSAFCYARGALFSVDGGSVHRSLDLGKRWSRVLEGASEPGAFACGDDTLLVARAARGSDADAVRLGQRVLVSTSYDLGKTWSEGRFDVSVGADAGGVGSEQGPPRVARAFVVSTGDLYVAIANVGPGGAAPTGDSTPSDALYRRAR